MAIMADHYDAEIELNKFHLKKEEIANEKLLYVLILNNLLNKLNIFKIRMRLI